MKFYSINLLKYLSLILVLSFFLLNNIYLVLGGILIALYEISNINITNLFIFKKRNSFKKEIQKLRYIKRQPEKIEINDEKVNHTLVEIIEELGYIPSLNTEKENDAA